MFGSRAFYFILSWSVYLAEPVSILKNEQENNPLIELLRWLNMNIYYPLSKYERLPFYPTEVFKYFFPFYRREAYINKPPEKGQMFQRSFQVLEINL